MTAERERSSGWKSVQLVDLCQPFFPWPLVIRLNGHAGNPTQGQKGKKKYLSVTVICSRLPPPPPGSTGAASGFLFLLPPFFLIRRYCSYQRLMRTEYFPYSFVKISKKIMVNLQLYVPFIFVQNEEERGSGRPDSLAAFFMVGGENYQALSLCFQPLHRFLHFEKRKEIKMD